MEANKGAGRPYYRPSPALQTSIGQGTGITAPPGAAGFTDWQQVVNGDPNLRGLSPEAATNYLRGAYGLSSDYKLDAKGNIVDTQGFLVRNLWWIAPTALVGGSALGSLGSGGGATATLGPSTPANIAATTAATTAGGPAAPAALTLGAGKMGAGVLPNIATTAATTALKGGGSTVGKILGLGAAGLGLANSVRQPPANKQLEDLLGIATDRVNSSKPLFDALQAMATAGLPTYARGK